MGISCDFEAGSMESEINPTCNKEIIKLNGQHELDAIPANTATTIETNEFKITQIPANDPIVNDTSSINDAIDNSKLTEEIINLTSPVQREVCLYTYAMTLNKMCSKNLLYSNTLSIQFNRIFFYNNSIQA